MVLDLECVACNLLLVLNTAWSCIGAAQAGRATCRLLAASYTVDFVKCLLAP
jgi:hypothetical protein